MALCAEAADGPVCGRWWRRSQAPSRTDYQEKGIDRDAIVLLREELHLLRTRRPVLRRQSTPPAPALALVVAAVLVLCACGASEPRLDGARRAATTFEAALARSDYAGACTLLAPRTRQQLKEDAAKPCGPALAGEELPAAGQVRATQVYGRQALLRMARDTLFLSQFDDGWKIVGAGCEPQKDMPYRCSLKGS